MSRGGEAKTRGLNGDPGRCFHRAGATPWLSASSSFELRPSQPGPDQGPLVRRHPAKLSLERLGSAFTRLRDMTSRFHASARLRPRSCPYLSPLEDSSGFGSRLSATSSLAERDAASGARCSPCSAPVQSGLPVGTFSCLTRDGLLSEHKQALTNPAPREYWRPVETVDGAVDKQ